MVAGNVLSLLSWVGGLNLSTRSQCLFILIIWHNAHGLVKLVRDAGDNLQNLHFVRSDWRSLYTSGFTKCLLQLSTNTHDYLLVRRICYSKNPQPQRTYIMYGCAWIRLIQFLITGPHTGLNYVHVCDHPHQLKFIWSLLCLSFKMIR